MKYIHAIILFITLGINTAFAQVYRPIDTADYIQRSAFIKKNNLVKEQFLAHINSKYTGRTRDFLKENYQHYQKDLERQIKEKKFIFNTPFEAYINKILKNLKEKNKNLPENLQILIERDNTPNAACIGDGTFIVNMGLFNWLDNEDQFAAVLGHELAHKTQDHNLKFQTILALKSENGKQQAKDIKKSRFNVADQAFNAYKSSVYQSSKERRINETEADDVGYIYFKNSDYLETEYVNAYKNLKLFDTISPKVLTITVYKKLFDLPNAPFKEKWLNKEDFTQYNYLFKNKLDKDSVSSHPETDSRIMLLQKKYPELAAEQKAQNASNEFLSLQKIAKMEIIPNFYATEDYGIGIYTALQLLQENDLENETYYKQWLGILFQKIYDARKNYTLNRYLHKIDPQKQSESYQQFLSFMWNLSLDDIKNIAAYYTKKGT